MARNDDRDRIGAIGASHCARGVGRSDAPREFAVRDGLAIRNVAQLAPDALMEGRAFGRERKIELSQFAREPGRNWRMVSRSGAAFSRQCGRGVAGSRPSETKEDVAQAGVIRRQQQPSDWAFHPRVED
jgi:hypothetical protein